MGVGVGGEWSRGGDDCGKEEKQRKKCSSNEGIGQKGLGGKDENANEKAEKQNDKDKDYEKKTHTPSAGSAGIFSSQSQSHSGGGAKRSSKNKEATSRPLGNTPPLPVPGPVRKTETAFDIKSLQGEKRASEVRASLSVVTATARKAMAVESKLRTEGGAPVIFNIVKRINDLRYKAKSGDEASMTSSDEDGYTGE